MTVILGLATGFLAGEGHRWPPGVHLLPAEVADRAARRVLGDPGKAP